MKILTGIDVPFQPFGGSLLCCDDWYSNLPDDVEVRFLTLSSPLKEKWWSIEDVVMLDIEKAKTPEDFPEYIRQLKKCVEEQIADYKPDIIHCQHLNYGLSRAFTEIDTTIPKIGICHGTDVQAAVGNPFFLDNLTRICDAMDLLLFPNQNMADDFFAVYKKEKKYGLNALGIPDTFFQTRKTPLFDGGGTLRVLYAGRLTAWKGADIAIEAMAHVRHDMHLTVVGNEDQKGFVQNLYDIVEKNGTNERVSFESQLPRAELLERFAQFDVIVFPSRRLEAFSLTVVEAQARGLPVVYSGIGGGIVNTVGDGGIIVSENTPAQLAEALDNLYEIPQILRDVQQKGYQNAERYRLSGSIERLITISTDTIDEFSKTN